MEKRLFLAIALALLVLISWSAFVSKTYNIDNTAVTLQAPTPIALKPIQGELSQAALREPPSSSLFKFSQEKYDIVFIESQAAIKEAIFKSYQNYAFPLKYGFLLEGTNMVFQKEKVTADSVHFVARDKDKEIKKHFLFSNTSYNIELEINVQNLSSAPLNINLPLVLGVVNLNGDQTEARLRDATLAGKDKVMHFNLRKDATLEEVKFLGFRDRYFCAIIEPDSDTYTGFVKKISVQEYEIGLGANKFVLAPNQQTQSKFNIYLGPQELRQITNIKPEWTAVMYYGKFNNFIAHLLLQLLDFIFGLVHNWGTTIVILSILIYAILYPLTLKQMRSMKQMQALQPRIEELRKSYKDNPKKLNTEIMKLYREYKVNPFSGCLPLILQMPIFFALYQVLMRSVALKGAKFLWIKDLSLPDRLFILPTSIPFLGNEINLLPILMTIGMFIQQKFSMGATSTGSAEQQKFMMILFPLMFGFIFYHMLSGLVLYWFINSALMLLYQVRISRQK
ncbi:MAG: membrane protein insertase YidC [Candidatus Omnitrophota bacterium]|nr:membrane protein insertase YidC [Candidatus Omnitrophota bacterium]